MANPADFLDAWKQLVSKSSPMVMMKIHGISETQDKVVVNIVSYCLSCFVLRVICLRITGEMIHYNQYERKTPNVIYRVTICIGIF